MKINIKSTQMAGYRDDGGRINILPGIYEAEFLNHTFSSSTIPESALEIKEALHDKSLFIRCNEYIKEINWENLSSDDNTYIKLDEKSL